MSITMEKQEQVKALLRKLFQFDSQDLDFGIYRIMNCKRAEIDKFIENDLIQATQNEFSEYVKIDCGNLLQELEQLKTAINRDFGEGTIDEQGNVIRNNEAPKIIEYLKKKEKTQISEMVQEQINDVFNNILEFFSRYYDKGDFISTRRYGGKSKYYVPYNGEEVLLYWANRDQYYVKTSEYFNKYSFNTGRYQISLILLQAEMSSYNRGEKRYFVLNEDESFSADGNEVKLFFDYRPLAIEERTNYGARDVQEEIVSNLVKEILTKIGPSDLYNALSKKIGENSTLAYHISRYVKRNVSDYFIHKKLRSFLENELDFYIKNELVDLEEYLGSQEEYANLKNAKLRVFRNLSIKIIEFLSQIEDFERLLYEKRKFVLKSDYCLTLDLVPPEMLDEIGKNEKQIQEWKKLLKLDEVTKGTLYDTNGRDTFDPEFLKLHQHLILDTKLFSQEFKDKLVSSFDDIDGKINGLIIKSENFQALNLLLEKYQNTVKCIYIDPPYNTGEDGFVYKDDYQDSSWISMMADRIALAWKFLREDGVMFVSCDFHESANLLKIMEQICDKKNYVATYYFKVRHEGRILLGDKEVQEVIENIICFKKPEFKIKKILLEENLEEYRYSVIEKISNPKTISLGGKEVKVFNKDEFEIIDEKANPSLLKRISVRGTIRKGNSSGRFFVAYVENKYAAGTLLKVENIGDDGLGYRYFHMPEGVKNGVYFQGRPLTQEQREKPYPTFYDMVDTFNTVGYEGDVDFKNGKKPIAFINKLFEISDLKPKELVLDFFAGSGSTGAAVIKLNETDRGNRKFILIEMADYFDTVLKPRIQKMIYSTNWKDGMPTSNNGTTFIFKYFQVEQYEDTLDNLIFSSKNASMQKRLDELDDYFLSYLLDYDTRESPTRLSIEQLKNPFDYKIKTNKYGNVAVDIPETFNYLLGLHVLKVRVFSNLNRQYRVIFGSLLSKQIAIIWRSTVELNLEIDKKFIEEIILKDVKPDTVYVNGDSYLENAIPLEAEFKRLMGA